MQSEIDDATFLSLLDSESEALSVYNIGFVRPEKVGDNIEGRLGGSGTLVTIDRVDGILTAAHVVRGFRHVKRVGLILSRYPRTASHEFTFDARLSRIAEYHAQLDRPSEGPDLAFLALPPDTISTLKAKKSFYNLSKRRDATLDRPPPRDHGWWAIWGIADEWTADVPAWDSSPNIKTKGYHGRLLARLFPFDWRASESFDYFKFDVAYGDGYGGPKSFGGYSGESVWQLLVAPDGSGGIDVVSRHLMGVPFYQSDIFARDGKTVREVTCHGPESIYRTLIDRMRQQSAAA
jgi:hypothetical protein